MSYLCLSTVDLIDCPAMTMFLEPVRSSEVLPSNLERPGAPFPASVRRANNSASQGTYRCQ